MHKWKKAMVGVLLLAGFAMYTQFKKSAEPVWKVDEKEFTIVQTLQEGMEREYRKFEELEIIDNFGLLQNGNKTLQLEEIYRTLKIEKIWNAEGRLYFLYSIDLKERDKDEHTVPRLTIKKIKLSTPDGKEEVFSARENTGVQGMIDDGFVYKHRLYRSMMVSPMIVNNEQMDWNLLIDANRIELQELELANKEGTRPIKNIALKVSSENVYEKVLLSSPINNTFTYGTNKKAVIHSYNILLYNRQLSLTIPNDDKELVGFSVSSNDQPSPYYLDIVGTKEKGYHLPFYEEATGISTGTIEKSLTFHSSIHKNNQLYSWTIPKEDIDKFSKNSAQPLIKSELIVNKNNTKIVYEGLSLFNGGPSVKISMLITNDETRDSVRLTPENYYSNDSIPEEYSRSYKKNLVSVTNEKKDKLKNFDILTDYSETKITYYITFYNPEELNIGEGKPISIPNENLTISLSDLVYSTPLSSPVTISYVVPDMNKIKE
ncbi:hypothetical protein KUV80_04565 [Fictibacillus nanhaiensis]|uniref:hypothetical protein n=1 Tax=Fictibacillus nanhaiensis TaxID=742169 RepID=UPI001C94A012|nr:hypothetical protein [Fictibacillus nanhaiensis]MBY6035908.1 hypothetical protein [Fictibacillus nanhaiensis]